MSAYFLLPENSHMQGLLSLNSKGYLFHFGWTIKTSTLYSYVRKRIETAFKIQCSITFYFP